MTESSRALDEYRQLHPADLADRLQRLPLDEAQYVLQQLPRDLAARALDELERKRPANCWRNFRRPSS